MGGEETLWREAYRMSRCIDCSNSLCGRCTDDMLTCQLKKLIKGLEEILESEEE